MKTYYLLIVFALFILGCESENNSDSNQSAGNVSAIGQSNVVDDVSQKDVVKIAAGSKDHTTLVTALKTAELINALSNAGPFTVFAPSNSAFDKLPKGTVDDLLKPENRSKLTQILYHHVVTSMYNKDMLKDGEALTMVDQTSAKITKKGNDIFIDKAKIIATVNGSNGIVHVIDEVLLPPQR